MFIDSFKDYVDYMYHLGDLLSTDTSLWEMIQASVFYIIKSTSLVFWYLISFKWLTGFLEIPLFVKQTFLAVYEGKSMVDAQYETQLDRGFFTFLETGQFNSNNLGTGFSNSFFLALPITLPQLLGLRALLLHGVPAAVCCLFGTVVGQFLFFACVLFGLDFFLFPWVSMHPLVVLGGSVMVVCLMTEVCHAPNSLSGIPLKHKNILFKYMRTTFLLAWLEQACVYGYFGNLTVNGTSTIFQTSDTNFLFSTFGYLLGLTIGTIVWSILFGIASVYIKQFLFDSVLTRFSIYSLTEGLSNFFFGTLLSLAMGSFPYYGFDYLAGQVVGFIADDHGLENLHENRFYESGLKDFYEGTNPIAKVMVEKEFMLEQRPEDDIEDQHEEQSYLHAELDRSEMPLSNLADTSHEANRYEIERRTQNRFLERVQNLPDEEDDRRGNDPRYNPNYQRVLTPFSFSAYDSLRVEKDRREREQYLNEENNVVRDIIAQKRGAEATDNAFEELCEAFAGHEAYNMNLNASDIDFDDEVELEHLLRERYFANPIYKILLRLDMYPFLTGENREHRVSVDDEYNLYKKRLLLEDYTNSILTYKASKTKDRIGFAHRVYNQQFKGTLNVIRQYDFVKVAENVDRDPEEEFYDEQRNAKLNKLKVLKYDQLLYKGTPNQENLHLHEELDPSLAKTDGFGVNISHQSVPMYIGWDGALRKFLVKTNVVPCKMNAGELAYSDSKVVTDYDLFDKAIDNENETSEKTKKRKIPKEIPDYYSFQAWSRASEDPTLSSTFLRIPYSVLTDQQLVDLKFALGFFDQHPEEESLIKDPNDILDRSPESTDRSTLQRNYINKLIRRMPHYDWYWKKYDDESMPMETALLDEEAEAEEYYLGYLLDLGNTVPAQLDGFAWPGVQDPIIIEKVVQPEEDKVQEEREKYKFDY